MKTNIFGASVNGIDLTKYEEVAPHTYRDLDNGDIVIEIDGEINVAKSVHVTTDFGNEYELVAGYNTILAMSYNDDEIIDIENYAYELIHFGGDVVGLSVAAELIESDIVKITVPNNKRMSKARLLNGGNFKRRYNDLAYSEMGIYCPDLHKSVGFIFYNDGSGELCSALESTAFTDEVDIISKYEILGYDESDLVDIAATNIYSRDRGDQISAVRYLAEISRYNDDASRELGDALFYISGDPELLEIASRELA